jgi:hypothetical protein
MVRKRLLPCRAPCQSETYALNSPICTPSVVEVVFIISRAGTAQQARERRDPRLPSSEALTPHSPIVHPTAPLDHTHAELSAKNNVLISHRRAQHMFNRFSVVPPASRPAYQAVWLMYLQ